MCPPLWFLPCNYARNLLASLVTDPETSAFPLPGDTNRKLRAAESSSPSSPAPRAPKPPPCRSGPSSAGGVRSDRMRFSGGGGVHPKMASECSKTKICSHPNRRYGLDARKNLQVNQTQTMVALGIYPSVAKQVGVHPIPPKSRSALRVMEKHLAGPALERPKQRSILLAPRQSPEDWICVRYRSRVSPPLPVALNNLKE